MTTVNAKPKIALIIGSTRAARFADVPAQWMMKQAQARDDMEVELLDLCEFNLPFFDEVASSAWVPSQSPEAVRCSRRWPAMTASSSSSRNTTTR